MSRKQITGDQLRGFEVGAGSIGVACDARHRTTVPFDMVTADRVGASFGVGAHGRPTEGAIMSTATLPSTRTAHPRRLALLALVPVVAAAGVGFAMLRDDGSSSPARTRAEVVASLDPAARAYVLGVVNMPRAQLAAGFGNVAYTGPADPGPRLHAGRV